MIDGPEFVCDRCGNEFTMKDLAYQGSPNNKKCSPFMVLETICRECFGDDDIPYYGDPICTEERHCTWKCKIVKGVCVGCSRTVARIREMDG
jgi:hypothetical protein